MPLEMGLLMEQGGKSKNPVKKWVFSFLLSFYLRINVFFKILKSGPNIIMFELVTQVATFICLVVFAWPHIKI